MILLVPTRKSLKTMKINKSKSGVYRQTSDNSNKNNGNHSLWKPTEPKTSGNLKNIMKADIKRRTKEKANALTIKEKIMI